MKKLMIAAAGAGKTTFLVQEALKIQDRKVLITTFTDENLREIKKKFIEKNGFIPKNIQVKTWYSFLLHDCLRPFQCLRSSSLHSLNIGFSKVQDGQSSPFSAENAFEHYFTSDYRIYSDKLSKAIIKLNQYKGDIIFNRLSRIYGYIFVDEVQDLSGYDLDIITEFLRNIDNVLLVGDPRQCTYSTNNSPKYKQFRNGKIKDFYDKYWVHVCALDEQTLMKSHRNEQIICELSSSLYPSFSPTTSCDCCIDSDQHLGVFIVPQSKKIKYLNTYAPTQLRWSSSTKVELQYKFMNMGLAKGITLDRVLLYPTKEMGEWLLNNNHQLAHTTRAKFYVGLTRSKLSLGILIDDKKINQFTSKFEVYK